MAIAYEFDGRTWQFRALPALPQTAEIYLAMSALSSARDAKGAGVMSAVLGLIAHLPWAIAAALEADHTPEEIDVFRSALRIDLSDPKTMAVLADLNQLFLGIAPTSADHGRTTPSG